MSVICQNFVQNAWRKDLCSNCFKSEDDHNLSEVDRSTRLDRLNTGRYIPQASLLYQNRGLTNNIQWRPLQTGLTKIQKQTSRDFGSQTNVTNRIVNDSKDTDKGILKDTSLVVKETRRCSVGFTSGDPLIIGYGGNDYDSDDSPWELGSDDGSIDWDLLDLTDEDRSITKITKNNTEFNSENKNLTSSPLLSKPDVKSQPPSRKTNEINHKNNNIVQNDFATKQKNNATNPSEKPISSYYFSATNKNTTLDRVRLLNQSKEMSLISNDIPSILNNIKNNNIKNFGSNKVENINENISGYNPKKETMSQYESNSQRYLLITKTTDHSSETSSDSDYSTSKQTMGESSTDTESFHDARENPMVPCSSFLHGRVHNEVHGTPQLKSSSYNDSKSFETSSDSSGDISSTLSDDSDIQKPSEKTKQKITKSYKTSQNIKKDSNITVSKIVNAPESNQKIQPISATNENESHSHENNLGSIQNVCGNSNSMKSNESEERTRSKLDISACKEAPTSITRVQSIIKNEDQVTLVTTAESLVVTCKGNAWNDVKDRDAQNLKTAPVKEDAHTKPELVTEVVESQTQQNTITRKSRFTSRSDSETSTSTQAEESSEYHRNDKLKEYHRWLSEKEDWNSTTCTPQSTPHSVSLAEATGSSSSSSRSSPKSDKFNRETKLAELALELEKVRCDAERQSESKLSEASDALKSVARRNRVTITRSKTEVIPASDSSNNYPSIRRVGRNFVKSAQISLPDLLPEPTTKPKKSRFSLKKLLKRGKDSDTLIINSSNDPKAWKRQQFDRARLSLEIVHPMDLYGDHDSITNDPSEKRSNASRARSLSALPHLISCVTDIGDREDGTHQRIQMSSTNHTRTDMPRKAGTVAERSKKYKAPRRTPSFSELKMSPSSGSQCTIIDSSVSSVEKTPNPPPPRRAKLLPPPKPPLPKPLKRLENNPTLSNEIPGTKETRVSCTSSNMCHNDTDCNYANLGDIRLTITPKKPQRPSAVSSRDDSEMESESPKQQRNPQQKLVQDDRAYEPLDTQEDEEDHYTYLDELEVKREKPMVNQSVSAKPERSISSSETVKNNNQCNKANLKKPWTDLQASYAAIAAANYESLAELITTAISEGLENFKKSTLQWSDFVLESDEPIQMLEDKAVYNAIYENQPKTKVTLMVTMQRQQTAQKSSQGLRIPILASFKDFLPRKQIDIHCRNYDQGIKDTTKAVIYVLQRSKATTVTQFCTDSARYQTNQHIHLRNACFVLLQLIHTLKILQAEGIEEINYDLKHILLLHTDVDKPPILALLPEDKIYLTNNEKSGIDGHRTTLCQTTLKLLLELLQIRNISEVTTCVVNGEFLAVAVANTFNVIARVLMEEKASSLSQAKGLLEYMLWGPVDINAKGNDESIDVMLQRWLDLQRAQMVKSLVSNLHLKISTHTGFHVYEEYQLIFLLQATVKSLRDVISKL